MRRKGAGSLVDPNGNRPGMVPLDTHRALAGFRRQDEVVLLFNLSAMSASRKADDSHTGQRSSCKKGQVPGTAGTCSSGDGGNRTRVRKNRPSEIYERIRLKVSPQGAQPAKVACSHPLGPEGPLSRR